MRRVTGPLTLLIAIAGIVVVWVFHNLPASGVPAVQAGEGRVANKPNLSLWVPDEELRVWDPVNANVNPVPWRVFGPKRPDGQRPGDFRHTAVDKRVRVEGIGWGYDVQTDLPKSRVVFEGGTILVKGVDFNKPEIRGKIVRVIGKLQRETMQPPGFQRQFPDYYLLDAESFEVIDRVTEPNVVLEPSKL